MTTETTIETGLINTEHRSRPFDPAMIARIEAMTFDDLILLHNELVKEISGAEPDMDAAILNRQELAVIRYEIGKRRAQK